LSKFSLNLCLPPTPPEQVTAALDAALRPFDMNLTPDWNPAGEWDWWRLDADAEFHFAVRPGDEGDPRLIHDPTGEGTSSCAGGPRGLLDFAATRAAAVARKNAQLRAEQDDFARLVADHPAAEPLTAFLARHRADPAGYPRERALADHHAQPLVRALNQGSAWQRYPALGVWVLGPRTDPITRFTRDPRPVLDHAAVTALAATALLTLDGHWIEPDRPGVFAAPLPGEDAAAAYARQSDAYLEALAGDGLVVRLLCHC
jgi:hypothetical protein